MTNDELLLKAECQIYRRLRSLSGDGLIASDWIEVGGRRRRIYRLTPAGHEALRPRTILEAGARPNVLSEGASG